MTLALNRAGELARAQLSLLFVVNQRSLLGIDLNPTTLADFMTFLTKSSHSRAVSFAEFRDFLLLLPRKATTAEIYQYYKVRKYMGGKTT